MSEINLLYGIKTEHMDTIKPAIRDELAKNGIVVVSDEHRDIKVGLQHELETRYAANAPLVLIISYRLEKNEPFTINELINYQRIHPNIRIILIISEPDRGILSQLFNNGIYDAIIDKEADISALARLIFKGRTVNEARGYYGIQSDLSAAEKVTLDSAYKVITQDFASNEELVKRIGWAKERLTEQEFTTLLSKLPDNLKAILAESEDYAKYYEDYIAQQVQKNAEVGHHQENRQTVSEVDTGLLKGVLTNVLRRNMIGVCSAQGHIGCTHNAIAIAHYLSEKGFRVGIIEYAAQDALAFRHMIDANSGSFKGSDGRYSWKQVDYYPEFDFRNLAQLNGRGYNFIVVDFGLLTKDKLYDFMSCVTQIVVTGSRAWETVTLDRIFSMVDKELLVNCNFLFYSTPTSAKIPITKNMAPLKVFFVDYDPDPFDGEVSKGIADLFEAYVFTGAESAKKKSILGGLFNGFKNI